MGPETVTQAELAEQLGYNPRQIRRWLDHPAAPVVKDGRYDVELWGKFAADYGRKSKPGSRKEELEEEKLEIANERQRLKLEAERGEWTRNEDIAADVRAMLAEHFTVLEEELVAKAPPELRERNRIGIRRAMDRLHRGAADIAEKHPPAPPAAA